MTRLEPVRDELGQIEFWVGTSTDIDELKHLQQLKDDFVSIASHELKTPLTSLKASMQLLQRVVNVNQSSENVPILVDKSNVSLNKLAELLDDLMNATKIEHGELLLKKSLFNIAGLINECCENVKLNGSHQFILKGDDELMIFADHARIEQVVINLMNNAVRYSPESDKIEISIERDGENARISVRDYGIGISAEKHSRLFNRYYKADSPGVKSPGLGLGLYISAEIISKHHGQIGVASAEGMGSTFWFTLPLNNALFQ